jgi:hypothetical protein
VPVNDKNRYQLMIQFEVGDDTAEVTSQFFSRMGRFQFGGK